MKQIIKISSFIVFIALICLFSSCIESTPLINQYTVTFKDYDETILRQEVVEEGHSATAPKDPERYGYIFLGWSEDYTNVYKNIICIAQYEKDSNITFEYKVTFVDYNGTILKEEIVEEGNSATAPQNPERSGYNFIGWDKEYINIQSNLFVIAQYEIINQEIIPDTYNVVFITNSNTTIEPQIVEKGNKIIEPTTPTKEGYTFEGWYLNDEKWNFIGYAPTSDIVLVAKWNIINYDIIYNLNGGFVSNPTTYTVEDEITLNNPTKKGYTFIGWTNDDILEPQMNVVIKNETNDKYFVANYIANTFRLVFDTDGGNEIEDIEYTIESSNIELPTPIRDGYEFIGWYEDDVLVSGLGLKDYNLVAKWELICYKINYQLDGGYYNIDYLNALEEVKNDFLADCAAHKSVSVEEIKFDTAANWQSNWSWGAFFATNADNGKNPAYPSAEAPSFWNVPANREKWLWLLEAIYNTMLAYPGGDTYTASLLHIENAFKSNFCGSPQTIAYAFWYFLNGQNHSYFGYNFGDTDGDGIANSENIINNYFANPITYTVEDEITLNNPTKVGYTFIGWTSEDLLEPQLNVKIKNQTGDKYFVANYSPIIYTITFDSNGGTKIKDIEYTIESADFTLPIPVRDDYGFLGWYDSKGNKFDKIEKGTFADINLIAKWDNTVYTVTYNLNGGEGAENNPTSYTVLESPITLINPTKPGYYFLGWYAGEEKVEKLTIGNLELVAKWELIEYAIIYNLNGGKLNKYCNNRAAMVDDFLNDAMAWAGKTNKPTCMVDDSGDSYGFANVFTSIYSFFSDAKYAEKWAWLKDYIIESTEGGSKDSLLSGSEVFWRFSLGAFLFEDCRGSWPKSADFTNDELANGFWDKLSKTEFDKIYIKYTIQDLPYTLDIPGVPEGKKFAGWFTNAELNGDVIYELPIVTLGDIELWAKYIDE